MLLNHNAVNPIIPPRVLAYTVMNGLVRLPESATLRKMSWNLGISKNTLKTPLEEKDNKMCPITGQLHVRE